MTVIADLVSNGDWIYRDGRWSTRRVFRVKKQSGTPSARMWLAYDASSVPRPGDLHPDNPEVRVTGIKIKSVRDDNGWFDIEYEYGESNSVGGGLSLTDEVEIDWGVQYITKRVTQDIYGSDLIVTYVNTNETATTEDDQLVGTKQLKSVEVQVPVSEIRITKTTTERPDELNAKYGKRVNSNKWSGFGERSIRCEGFTGSTSLESSLSRVTGTFLEAPNDYGTWDVLVRYSDQGTLPVDATEGNGFKFFRVIEEARLSESGFVLY